MNFLKKYQYEILFLGLILILSGILRFYNLGYSDYQGDEIKALFNVRNNKEFFEFLLDQKKGPNQFLITLALRNISNDYYNYFVMRLPFAFAGFFSLILFYLVIRNFFNLKVALYSTVFMGSSGFLVGFSRIVQYQSFVIFFGLFAIFLIQKFENSKKFIYLYLSFASLALGILFHYDSVFFGLPVGLIILKNIYEDRNNKNLIKNFILATLTFTLILASFYVPFALNIGESAKNYLLERIEGVEGISSSVYNFNLYQPYFSLYIYIFFGVLGLIYIFKNYKEISNIFLFIWVLVPFLFYELLMGSPGTHIYCYLIPIFIILGLGISFLENLLGRIKLILYFFLILISFHLFLQSYVLFVENKTEYPWQDKKYLYFDLKGLTQDDNKKYYLSIFGFPYNRNWLEIKDFLKETQGEYDSSEKSTIGNFYLRHLKFRDNASIYVEVEKPQSFARANRRQFTPVKIFENNNGTKSYIYFLK